MPLLKIERSCICVVEVSILPLSNDFYIRIWNCSDSVLFFFLHFITQKTTHLLFRVILVIQHILLTMQCYNDYTTYLVYDMPELCPLYNMPIHFLPLGVGILYNRIHCRTFSHKSRHL